MCPWWSASGYLYCLNVKVLAIYINKPYMTKYYLWENVFVRCKIASHNVPRAVLYKGFLVLVYQEYYTNN